jgi:hypothetical protein
LFYLAALKQNIIFNFWEAFSLQKLQIELLWAIKKCILREKTSLLTISYVQTWRDACIMYTRIADLFPLLIEGENSV